MKKQRHEIGTIIAWANDGEEAYFDTIEEAYQDLIERDYDVSLEDFTKTLGTSDEIASGVTCFRYGIDKEATKGYDDAWNEVEKDRAKEEEEENESIKKFEIRSFSVETKDGYDPEGVFNALTNQDTDLIESFDSLEEAMASFENYEASVRKDHYRVTRYLHDCYVIEENDYDEDGEWVDGGNWWKVLSKEWEEEEEEAEELED